jgi:hypothetical protein
MYDEYDKVDAYVPCATELHALFSDATEYKKYDRMIKLLRSMSVGLDIDTDLLADSIVTVGTTHYYSFLTSTLYGFTSGAYVPYCFQVTVDGDNVTFPDHISISGSTSLQAQNLIGYVRPFIKVS